MVMMMMTTTTYSGLTLRRLNFGVRINISHLLYNDYIFSITQLQWSSVAVLNLTQLILS